MCGEDECEVTGRASSWKVANFRFASAAEVTATGQIAVASTQSGILLDDPGGKAHHE